MILTPIKCDKLSVVILSDTSHVFDYNVYIYLVSLKACSVSVRLLVAECMNIRFAGRNNSCAAKAPPGGSSTRQSSLLPWTTTNWNWNYCQSFEKMKLCHIVVHRGKEMDRWATGADKAVLKEEEKAWQLFFFVLFYWMKSSLSFTSLVPYYGVNNGCIWKIIEQNVLSVVSTQRCHCSWIKETQE